jgi:flagellar motor component MotA
MNVPALVGLITTLAVLVFAILIGSNLFIFFDATSVIIVVFGTAFMTLATHGTRGLQSFFQGVRRVLVPKGIPHDNWSATDLRRVAEVARTGGISAILMAGCGDMIGLTQMLQNMSDPSALGPAMAVCMLTSLYAIVLNLLVFVPLSRFFSEAAIDAEAATQPA